MLLRVKHWPLFGSLIFAFLLTLAYFWGNPTALTYGRVRLTRSCIHIQSPGFQVDDLIRDFEKVFDSERNDCQLVKPVIHQMYEWEIASRPLLDYSEGFKVKIREWLKSSNNAEAEFQNQVISTVYNKWTRSMTSRNPLRRKKPRIATADNLNRLLQNQSSQDCDFCRGKYAKDIFLDNTRASVGANAFKLQDYNALFIFKEHNPLKLELQDYSSIFQLANQWFKLAAGTSKEGHDQPTISWDSLPPSGGSQIHGHMHGFLGRGSGLGRFRGYEDARQLYHQVHTASDFTQDFINVHVALGLAFRVGALTILSPLDPICNHELMIFSPQVDDSFAEMVYLLHRTFIDELQELSWSSAMTWPNQGDLAKLVIGARSDNHPITSMELYLFSSVTSNPYETIDAVQRTLQRMSSRSKK